MSGEGRGRFLGRVVTVLCGGLSAEREVSLVTGNAVADALRGRGHHVEVLDAGVDLVARLCAARPEVVFNALHGTWGEDGRVQGLLDWLGVPYTGEGLRTSVLSMDKVLTKERLVSAGVSVAPDRVLSREEAAATPLDALPFGLPVVVKPVSEGSSVGCGVVRTEAEWAAALGVAAAAGDVLVEPLLTGAELSVVCLADAVLGSVEIEPARAFYDYEAKYGASGTRYHLPPRVPEAARQAAERAGLATHRALGCRGVTRIDLFVTGAGPVVLELNTVPGMTPTSLVPKVAARAGLDFGALCDQVLELAAWGPARTPWRRGEEVGDGR